MANRREIRITISPTGEVSYEVAGVSGPACLAETKFLDDALGNDIASREKKGEFYEPGEVETVKGRYR